MEFAVSLADWQLLLLGYGIPYYSVFFWAMWHFLHPRKRPGRLMARLVQ